MSDTPLAGLRFGQRRDLSNNNLRGLHQLSGRERDAAQYYV